MTLPVAVLTLIKAFPGAKVVRTTAAVREACERLAREKKA